MGGFFNVFLALGLLLPIFFGLVVLNADRAPYTYKDLNLLITWDDLQHNFLSMFQLIPHLHSSEYSYMKLSLALFIINFLDSLYYNIKHAYFPEDTVFRSGQERSPFNQLIDIASYVWTFCLWTLLLLFLWGIIAYLVLIIIWLSLGAIINPSNFLFYATCAVTLAVFFALKLEGIIRLVR
jgi:hypothetical protein